MTRASNDQGLDGGTRASGRRASTTKGLDERTVNEPAADRRSAP